MSESIWAQWWGGGYNYGGLEALIKHKDDGLKAFNYEQQACIIEEYFRLKHNIPLQWTRQAPELEELLEGYCREVRVIK